MTKSGNFTLTRYKADGSGPDLTFGAKYGRTVTIAGALGGGAQDMVLQRNGRILLAGYGIDAHREWTAMVTAYKHNGAPELRFGGGDGIAALKPTDGGEVPIRLVAVKALRSGRILAAGDIGGRVMLTAYHANGRPDHNFGNRSLRYTDVDGSRRCVCTNATDMEVDRRGRIIVSANLTGPGKRQRAALVRYHPNGRLDRSFGHNGIARAVIGSRLAGKAIAIQPNGRILLAGTYNVPGTGEARVAAVRFLPNGRLDRSFARRGFFTRDFGHEGVAYAALTQRDGRVVIGGRVNRTPSPFEAPSIYDTAEVFLIRFLR